LAGRQTPPRANCALVLLEDLAAAFVEEEGQERRSGGRA
jgi:hypothetical protein